MIAASLAWWHANRTRKRQERQQGEIDELRKEYLQAEIAAHRGIAEAELVANVSCSMEWVMSNMSSLVVKNQGPAQAADVTFEIVQGAAGQGTLRREMETHLPIGLMDPGDSQPFSVIMDSSVESLWIVRLRWSDGRGAQGKEVRVKTR